MRHAPTAWYPWGVPVWLESAALREPPATVHIQDHPNIAGTDPHTAKGTAMQTKTYTVTGMTCAHCVNSVSTEIGKLGGVSDVQVDLSSGTITVTSDQPLDDDAVRAAVDEAGYEVAR